MIFPKKEILYAPMLGTLGGGSLRSFGRGTGGSADLGYWGVDYDGWDGSQLQLPESNISSRITTNGDANWGGLEFHIVHNRNRFFTAYPNNTSQTFVGAQASYPNPANASSVTTYYNVSSAVNLNTNTGSSGRGVTIAYLGDNTPVLIMSYQGTSYERKLRFWTVGTSPSHLGDLQMTGTLSGTTWDFQSNNNNNGEFSQMFYDGSGLVIKNRSGTPENSQWVKVSLPSDANIANGGTPQYLWTMDSQYTGTYYTSPSQGYGCAYLGMDSSGYRYVYENWNTSNLGGRIIRLTPQIQGGITSNWVFKDSASNGGGFGTAFTQSGPMEIPTAEYACAVDYRNNKLLTGSHSNGGIFQVFDLV
jgi:hypothetical protein